MAVEHNGPLTDFCLITLQQTMTPKLSHCMAVCSLVSGRAVKQTLTSSPEPCVPPGQRPPVDPGAVVEPEPERIVRPADALPHPRHGVELGGPEQVVPPAPEPVVAEAERGGGGGGGRPDGARKGQRQSRCGLRIMFIHSSLLKMIDQPYSPMYLFMTAAINSEWLDSLDWPTRGFTFSREGRRIRSERGGRDRLRIPTNYAGGWLAGNESNCEASSIAK